MRDTELIPEHLTRAKNRIGERYGLLTVVERAPTYRTSSGNPVAAWWCICDCNPGIRVYCKGTALATGDKRSCGCLQKNFAREHIRKLAKKNRGPLSPSWRGGVSPKRAALGSSPEYKAWRKAVFERDNYTCQICGKRGGGDLNADHIIPYHADESLALNLDNGRTLCVPCHRRTDTYGTGARKFAAKYKKGGA